jgi:hypothetical protein
MFNSAGACDPKGPDADLAAQLAKLWPHRNHESSAFKAFFCACGAHQWRALNLAELSRGKQVRYCFWCSKLKIDDVIY